ncbi:MAG: hypothetical protein P4N59_11595 [Negativicutes bacterium]|nr:hypothetical protein [Negativicutes bacterium]
MNWQRVRRLHWHHHIIRGAILAHLAHAIVTVTTEWNYSGIIDTACLSFVILELVDKDKEEREREKAEAENVISIPTN